MTVRERERGKVKKCVAKSKRQHRLPTIGTMVCSSRAIITTNAKAKALATGTGITIGITMGRWHHRRLLGSRWPLGMFNTFYFSARHSHSYVWRIRYTFSDRDSNGAVVFIITFISLLTINLTSMWCICGAVPHRRRQRKMMRMSYPFDSQVGNGWTWTVLNVNYVPPWQMIMCAEGVSCDFSFVSLFWYFFPFPTIRLWTVIYKCHKHSTHTATYSTCFNLKNFFFLVIFISARTGNDYKLTAI